MRSIAFCKAFIIMCSDIDFETGQYLHTKGPCCKGIFQHFVDLSLTAYNPLQGLSNDVLRS